LQDTVSDPLLKTIPWPYASLHYPVVNSIGVDWPHGGYGADPTFHGWHGYKILLPNSPLLAGTGLNSNDILSCTTREFDGTLISGYNSEGDPIVDTASLGFCKTELIGYDWGVSVNSSGKGYETFVAFKKNASSGNVINTGSCNWCSRYEAGISGGFGSDDVGKVEQITLNMFNLLLAHDNIYTIPGCLSSTSHSITNAGQLEFFPNPASKIFNIRYTPELSSWTDENDIHVEIYNVFGIKIYDKLLRSQLTTEVDFSSQPNGIYFIHLITSKENKIQKIIISNNK
jgi:hypothetical protein